MLHTWFEVKIRYDKTMEDGMVHKVTEQYLFDALSFTESEGRCINEMAQHITGEYTVVGIKRANYHELFPSKDASADRWYKGKLVFTTLDEKSGTEKKTTANVLIQASDFHNAVESLDEAMKGTISDYEIASISETPIMDVYPFNANE